MNESPYCMSQVTGVTFTMAEKEEEVVEGSAVSDDLNAHAAGLRACVRMWRVCMCACVCVCARVCVRACVCHGTALRSALRHRQNGSHKCSGCREYRMQRAE